MMDTTSNPGNYQRIFRLKALHLEFLQPRDQLFLVDHYLYYCQTAARYMHEEAKDMRGPEAFAAAAPRCPVFRFDPLPQN